MPDIFDSYKNETKAGDIFDSYLPDTADQQQQFALGLGEGALGTAGNLLELAGVNPQASLTPSQELRAETESEKPAENLINTVSDELFPEGTGRFPTTENISQLYDLLGLNAEARTPEGEASRKGGQGGGAALSLGAGIPAAILSSVGSGTGETIRQQGGPEWLATAADLGISLADLIKSGFKTLTTKKAISKPSGLSERQFEGVKFPVKVTSGTKERAVEGVRSEFSNIAEKIHESANKTVKTLRQDPSFEKKLSEGFQQLEQSGAKIDEITSPGAYQKNLSKQYSNVPKKGFESSQGEKKLGKLMRDSFKSAGSKEHTFDELVDQFRKNNAEVRKYSPFGPTAIENEAQREALLLKNRAIADTIEQEFGHLPEAKEFTDLNAAYRDVQRVKTVDKFVDSIFPEGKIEFGKAKRALSDGKTSRQLENALGKKHFQDFKQLASDLLEYEPGLKLLKDKGYSLQDLGEIGVATLIKPSFAKTKLLGETISKFWRRGLSDPKFAADWSDAINIFNSGDIKKAVSIVDRLSKQSSED